MTIKNSPCLAATDQSASISCVSTCDRTGCIVVSNKTRIVISDQPARTGGASDCTGRIAVTDGTGSICSNQSARACCAFDHPCCMAVTDGTRIGSNQSANITTC